MFMFQLDNNHLDIPLSDSSQIHTYSWQYSTIEEQNNVNDWVCVTISPSQFHSLRASNSTSVSFARHILLYIFEHIHASRIIILIADEIQKFNIAIFQHKNEKRSLEIALAQGKKITSFFTEAYDQLSSNGFHFHKVKILCWTDVNSSGNYDQRVQDIRQYISDNELQCGPLIDKVKNKYNPIPSL